MTVKAMDMSGLGGHRTHRDLAGLWRRALLLWGVFALAASLAMAPTLAAMVTVWWNSATFNHGLLIPFIIAWLVWDRRKTLAQVRPGLYPLGLIPMAGALMLWLLGRVGDVQMVQQFGWVFLMQFSVLTLLGLAATRALLFPLGYMLFLVPFGEFLIPPLQHFTAQFIVAGLQTLDIPVFLEDVFLSTPSGDFEVAQACSGVRFLIATLALGVLFANISFKSWRRRAVVVALAVIVPIIANGLRAFGIVYIAYLTDNE
ncbi:MAG: exosortase A, partial [Alphaproteobacteria bacterium]